MMSAHFAYGIAFHFKREPQSIENPFERSLAEWEITVSFYCPYRVGVTKKPIYEAALRQKSYFAMAGWNGEYRHYPVWALMKSLMFSEPRMRNSGGYKGRPGADIQTSIGGGGGF